MERNIWKEMYLTMVSGVSDAIEQLPLNGDTMAALRQLKETLADAEELYLETEEDSEEIR